MLDDSIKDLNKVERVGRNKSVCFFQIETMDLFLDPKGKPGTNQLMFYYQEPEDKEPHGMYFLCLILWNRSA